LTRFTSRHAALYSRFTALPAAFPFLLAQKAILSKIYKQRNRGGCNALEPLDTEDFVTIVAVDREAM
jgi:hypothetical protein